MVSSGQNLGEASASASSYRGDDEVADMPG